jgi:erythromycin esterase
MKRSALLALLVLAACDSGPSEAVPPPPPPTPADYIRENAVRVRTLNFADEDFSDLQPLKQMIGDARIVSLGEATHGDGATFQAKARLVRFLHKEMGFDVLAWESGFWDVRKAWSFVQAGEPVVPSLQRGIFGVWTRSAEMAPLLEYLAAASRTSSPIHVVGIDMQFSSAQGADRAGLHLAPDLRALLEQHGSTAAADPRFAVFAAGLPHMNDDSWLYQKPPAAEQQAFLASAAFLRDELIRLGGGSGGGELAYWVQVMESVAENARGLWAWTDQGSFAERNVYSNLRDRQMGRNLDWYASRAFPGRKIIVWAATSHVVRNRGPLSKVSVEAWMSLGDHAHASFGSGMYVIGFTSYDGVFGNAGRERFTIAPAPAQSLEALFVEAGVDLGIVDLRNPSQAGAWLRGNFSSRAVGHQSVDFTWHQALDALMFIRTMTPSTEWSPGS